MIKKPERIRRQGIIKLLSTWMPVLIWAIVIFTFSSLPTSPVVEIHWQDFIIKKSAHVVEYGVLALLLYRAFILSNISRKNAILLSFLISVLYGVSDEFHQSFTPGRDPKIRDILFDTLGAAFSLYFIGRILPKSPAKIKTLAKSISVI